jgi:hypothetical protein
MRRALSLLLGLVLAPALASGALLRSDGYYKEKFVEVRGRSPQSLCLCMRVCV